MRLFTAIQLPDDVRDQVARLSAHYCDRLTARLGIDVDPTAIKWVREDNLHVTLKFLGDVADEDVLPLCDALAQIAPVTEATLRVDRADCLPPRGPIRIIAAGLGGDVHLVELLFAAIERA